MFVFKDESAESLTSLIGIDRQTGDVFPSHLSHSTHVRWHANANANATLDRSLLFGQS